MLSLFGLSTVLAYVHVYLNPPDAISFAKRWKPQSVAGHLLSVSGINKYTRACIDLNSDRCTGGVVQISNHGSSCLYIIHRNSTSSTDDGNVHVVSILWEKEEQMLVHMRELRAWYDHRFSDELYGSHIRENMERDLWDISGMEF